MVCPQILQDQLPGGNGCGDGSEEPDLQCLPISIMADFKLQTGIPQEDIIAEHRGFRGLEYV